VVNLGTLNPTNPMMSATPIADTAQNPKPRLSIAPAIRLATASLSSRLKVLGKNSITRIGVQRCEGRPIVFVPGAQTQPGGFDLRSQRFLIQDLLSHSGIEQIGTFRADKQILIGSRRADVET